MSDEKPDILTKTLSELEREHDITEENRDFSRHYLGVPPSKKFYKEKEVNFEGMREKFNRLLRRLKLK